jgi:nitric oxide reductase NorD protein
VIELAAHEERLALFAEGIAGRYYHIKAAGEFAGRAFTLAADRSALSSDTVFLPERLDGPDDAAFRVLVLQQLGHREFGSFAFDFATALDRLPGLTDREVPTLAGRASDFERFYHQFPAPALMSRLLHLCERVRVDALMVRRYPGIRRHLERVRAFRLAQRPPDLVDGLGGVLHAVECRALDADRGLLESLDLTGVMPAALNHLEALVTDPGDVYHAAGTAMALYGLTATLIQDVEPGAIHLLDDELGEPANWLQREARLQDWRDDLAAMDSALAVEQLLGDEVTAADSEGLTEGELRPDDLALKSARDERDNLARRIDMERAAIRDALGSDATGARSFRYDEWDYRNRRYLPRWCRLFESRLDPDHTADVAQLHAVIRAHSKGVQKRLEQIRPLGYQRTFRQADGDELDFNAVIRARQDVRAGQSPDDRVYSRRERVHRDVCAAFLVDLSASTDDAAGEDDDGGERRIIDVQREAMLVMSAALERLGDSYGVYGFSGYGRDCVEFYVAKEPSEPFRPSTLTAIAGMKPKRSTRMGPAIRHTVAKLQASGSALRVLLIISDGFPQDCDYGPERGEHEYGVQDTARALREAHDKGVETFCITVDRSGHDYLKRMCPERRYLVIEEVADLPEQLSKVYETLTA